MTPGPGRNGPDSRKGPDTGPDKGPNPPRPSALTFVGSTEEIRIGAVVVDRYSDLPGTVCSIVGRYVRVERPSGRVWDFHYRLLRPATEYEKRQLAALGRLHRNQRSGPP